MLESSRTWQTKMSINARCELVRTCRGCYEGCRFQAVPFLGESIGRTLGLGSSPRNMKFFWKGAGGPRHQEGSKQHQELKQCLTRGHQCGSPGKRHHQRRRLGSERRSLQTKLDRPHPRTCPTCEMISVTIHWSRFFTHHYVTVVQIKPSPVKEMINEMALALSAAVGPVASAFVRTIILHTIRNNMVNKRSASTVHPWTG
jgi:hypothetical protein